QIAAAFVSHGQDHEPQPRGQSLDREPLRASRGIAFTEPLEVLSQFDRGNLGAPLFPFHPFGLMTDSRQSPHERTYPEQHNESADAEHPPPAVFVKEILYGL